MAYLRVGGPRFMTVFDKGGVKFVKSSVYTLWTTSDFERLQLHKYNILMFNKC